MNRADRKRWASARTLTDLGELVVAWLRGEIRQTLHNAFGPGCPYCTAGNRGAAVHALAAQGELITAGFTKPERAAFLAAWDKPVGEWTATEAALIARYDSRKAVA